MLKIRVSNPLRTFLLILMAILMVTPQSNKRVSGDDGLTRTEYTKVSVRQRQNSRPTQDSSDQDGQSELQGFGMGLNLDGGLSGHGGMTILGGPFSSRGLIPMKARNLAGCRRYYGRQQSAITTSTTEMAK